MILKVTEKKPLGHEVDVLHVVLPEPLAAGRALARPVVDVLLDALAAERVHAPDQARRLLAVVADAAPQLRLGLAQQRLVDVVAGLRRVRPQPLDVALRRVERALQLRILALGAARALLLAQDPSLRVRQPPGQVASSAPCSFVFWRSTR